MTQSSTNQSVRISIITGTIMLNVNIYRLPMKTNIKVPRINKIETSEDEEESLNQSYDAKIL
mgnify:CR=1 FL=1